MNFRSILYVIGLLFCVLSVSMLLPMSVDLYFESENWRAFFLCSVITAFFGGALVLSNADKNFNIRIREAFLLTVLSWIFISLFAALPFHYSTLDLNFTDSFFEAMSGITTTGATVITNLENAPKGILLWRAILQWLGGIGIIIMAMSVMPFLKVGGMQIFRTELSEDEKALPKTAKLASSIAVIYIALTALCAICFILTGMNPFDGIAHAMTTLSTGGFSTFDSSFGNYDNPWPEIVAIVFMIMGCLPFVLYLKAVKGSLKPLLQDTQVRWFLTIIVLSVFVMVCYLTFQSNIPFGESLRRSTFNIVSLISGTGFANWDYNAWGGFSVSLFFFLMVVGGCAGSTTCGIKIFRFQVLYEISKQQIKQLLYPHGVFVPHYNRKPIPRGVPMSVMSFFFLYALSFSLIAIALSYVGLDFLTAMSGAVTCLSNVGPGLGETIGPSGTFQSLPSSAKWILSLAMLLGRLELFPVLVLSFPQFWKA